MVIETIHVPDEDEKWCGNLERRFDGVPNRLDKSCGVHKLVIGPINVHVPDEDEKWRDYLKRIGIPNEAENLFDIVEKAIYEILNEVEKSFDVIEKGIGEILNETGKLCSFPCKCPVSCADMVHISKDYPGWLFKISRIGGKRNLVRLTNNIYEGASRSQSTAEKMTGQTVETTNENHPKL
jgi:hypothetical protein